MQREGLLVGQRFKPVDWRRAGGWRDDKLGKVRVADSCNGVPLATGHWQLATGNWQLGAGVTSQGAVCSRSECAVGEVEVEPSSFGDGPWPALTKLSPRQTSASYSTS